MQLKIQFKFFSTFILTVIFYLFTGNVITANASVNLNPEEQSWLDSHSEIRIGTMNNWPPMDFIDSRGKPQGIGARFIDALNRRLNNKIKIVPGSWNKIYNDVKEHKLDAIMGITPRPDREKFFQFTAPYVTVPHAIFAKNSSEYLHNLSDLKGKKVAIERGFFIANLLRKKYPKTKVLEYDSTSDALDALTKGEADAYVGNRAVAMYIIESELITNIKQFGKITETSSINAIGVRKDQAILRDILQKALNDISQSERHQIFSKWAPSEITKTLTTALSEKEKQWIAKHPVIRIAFDENYPPYSFRNEQGEFIGIAVDYARELTKRIGLKIEIYPQGEWKKLYLAAQQHKVDVIATLVKRGQREQWFEFTRPYISLAQYIITRKEDMDIFSQPAKLSGKTVALIEGYSMTRVILDEIRDIKPLYVTNLDEALRAVSAGKADATIGAMGIANHMILKAGILNLGFASLYSKGQSEQRFGVRKDWPQLATILNKGLQSLSDEKVIAIFERWTQPQVAKTEAEFFETKINLSEDERIWLARHPVIRTASDPDWAPIEYVDSKGKLAGISSDYINLLEKILKVKFKQVQNQSWTEIIKNFKKGEIDLLTSLNRTPEREKFILFTDSYTHFPIGIFSSENTSFINDMSELRNKNVGVVEGYATEELLETNYPDIKLTKASNPANALDLLSHGNIDAYIGNILVTSYYISKLGYSHIKIIGKTPYQYEQSMGIRKDWPLLASILNKALSAIPESEKNAIYKKWIGVTYEYSFDYSLLWKILLAVFVLFVIFTYWNRKLSTLNRQLVLARQQEEKARIAAEQVNEQLKKLDTLKSMFIASMSHELRTPLNSIIGFSGLLLQGVSGEVTEKQKDSIERISRAGNHLLGLISDIIDISKIEAGRVDIFPQQIPLKEVVDEAVESIQPLAAEKGMSIQVVATNWPLINTDRKRLLQCLLNYLSNAVKYSEKGDITLTVTLSDADKNVRIDVKDNGIGIAEKDQAKLFEAFERFDSHLKVKAGGTGLGLYLTKKIAEDLLHGHVEFKSEVGKGSTFSLQIPVNAFNDTAGLNKANE